jgi:hypothetical protein
MTYNDALKRFEENLSNAKENSETDKINLYQGLMALTEAIETDVREITTMLIRIQSFLTGTVGEDMREIKETVMYVRTHMP